MPSPFQLQRLPSRKKPASTRALLFLVLLALFVCAGLAGCDAHAEPEASEPESPAGAIRMAARDAFACPGMHAEWLDAQTVQCLKEKL